MKWYNIITYISTMFSIAFSVTGSSAQSISGYIQNENNEPIPYVNVFIQELGSGTASDEKGFYFLTLEPGEYKIIYSALGYTSKTIRIVVDTKPIRKDVWINSSGIDLEQVFVKASKRDSAYAIIKKAINVKKDFLNQVQSYRTNVYIKATETIDEKEKAKRKKKKEVPVSLEGRPINPFEEEEKKKLAAISGISLIESELILNYQHPKKYKEERIAYEAYGDKGGLFIPRFGESEFNFYRNLVHVRSISEVPLISPLSKTAILSYKYKLVESKIENGRLVYKIKVIPRKKGNATCSGYIYINEGLWNINRLEFSYSKTALKFFDAFQIKQNYQQLDDGSWLPYRVEFIYETKQGKRKTFKGKTLLHYTNYENDYPFPPKFFGNEVAVTTADAYERDSSYWNQARPEPLTIKQQKLIAYKDSVKAILNSVEYKDSMQLLYNKVTLLDIIWDGVGFRNHSKRQEIYFGSLPSFIDFEVVGGFRLGPYTSYFKQWENGKWLSVSGNLSLGINNLDPQGNAAIRYQYNPNRLAQFYVSSGRSFQSLNPNDAILNQLRTSNYFLHDNIYLGQQFELFNGLFFKTDFSINNRKSVEDYDNETVIGGIIENETAVAFEPYQAFVSDISLSYTPQQKFMTEPRGKIILGSKWPTFRLRHKKGWNNILSSDVDFDFIDFSIEQDLILGIFGNSKYTIQTGNFLNTKELRFVDLKRFNQSNPYLYSDPLYNFQLLDTALTGTNFYIELHQIHHFNGALINNIPLIRQLRVHVVAGANFLWVQENKFRHEELFTGLERVFKLGPRRRLRVGAYGVLANSNTGKPKTAFKISLDIIDTWKRNWSF